MNELKHNLEITEKLPKEFKDKWVKALRSGDYEQGRERLISEDKCTYCCFGVSCIISGFTKLEIYGYSIIDRRLQEKNKLAFDKIPSLLHDTDKYWKIINFLTEKNDAYVSFKDIANWIEKYL